MSGIYISGMEMPTNCTKCPCSNDETRYCHAANEYIPMLGKPQFCPIIPVPDHGRLIDADALQSVTIEQQSNDYNIKAVPRNWAYAFCAFEEIVADAPTVIPADGEEVDP